MSKPMSVDFYFSVQQRGRGAKKQIVAGTNQLKDSSAALVRIPRISRFMALAIHFEDLIRKGIVCDYAELARLGHVSRARATQIMNLRLLAPEIQEELLFLDQKTARAKSIQLRTLQTIAVHPNWNDQRELWKARAN